MNQNTFSRRTGSSIPNVIFALLIANGLVFALQQMNANFMFINFALWPATDPRSPFMPWQLLTYGFLHGNTMHIFFNMFGLWMFGRDIEGFMGSQRFLTYFLVCVVGAGIVQLVVAGPAGRAVSDGRRLRGRFRDPACLRIDVSEPYYRATVSAHPHAGDHVRVHLRTF